MSSTDRGRDETPRPTGAGADDGAVARLFDEVLVPLARRLREAGAVLADVEPRRAAESYYEPVASITRADFESVPLCDPEVLRAALLQQWSEEPLLHELADALARLSGEIDVGEEQSAEVSPFLYVMF